MATSPMMQPAMGQDGAELAEADDGSTELCIKISQDGTISVYKETGEDEAAEDSAEQVGDIGQALSWCLREYKAMSGGKDAVSDLQAGFGGPQTKPMMAG